MLRVTFKNVGQGDSIILEWNDNDGLNKIGIIDCNILPDHTSPVLEYIQSKKVAQIEFIILSHPHFDHFSGLLGILDHCEQNNIHIKYFLHTSMQVPDYLRTATISALASSELAKLFLKVRTLNRNGIIEDHGYITDHSREIELNNLLKLKFLSPSTIEFDNFINNVQLFHDEDGHNNPNANWLSTFIKIYSDDWYILLTSDVDKTVLLRVGTRHPEELEKELFLGQSPHHGSLGNHRNSFWKTGIQNRLRNTPIIFSVGNNIYNHPSSDVVRFFRNYNFHVFSTNQIGCLKIVDNKIDTDSSMLLDSVSTLLSTKTLDKQLNGDQVFLIDNNHMVYCEAV